MTKPTHELESDADRLRLAPGRAFDWVGRELQFPTDAEREVFKATFLTVANEGHRAVKKLEAVWPSGARWPNGEAHLLTLGWRDPDEFEDDDAADAYADEYEGPELMELLYKRLSHVGHRMYRDAQVRDVLDPASPRRISRYTHARLNRDGEFRGDPCGYGVDKIISIEDALKLMEQPSHDHPACCCTLGPFPV